MKQKIFISNENTGVLAIEDSGFLFQEPNSMNDELSNIDVIKLEEDERNLSKQTDVVDAAFVSIEELTNVVNCLDEINGLSGDAARIAQIATEAICSRLGYKPDRTLIPSLESFKYSHSRVQATSYAIEAIGEVVDKIWEAIKKIAHKIWDFIKGIFHKAFDASYKNDGQISILSKKISNIKISKKVVNKDKQLDLVKYCDAFSVQSPNQIKQGAINLMKQHLALAEGRSKINKNIIQYFDKLDDNEKMDEVTNSIAKDFIVGEKTTNLAFGYVLTTKLDGDRGYILSMNHNKIKTDKAEGAALDISALEELFEQAKKLNNELKESKVHAKETEHIMKKVSAFADRMSKTNDNSENGKRRAGIVKNIQTAIGIFNGKLVVVDAKLVASTLAFIDLNLTAYM